MNGSGNLRVGRKHLLSYIRVHEKPLPEKLEDFNRFIAKFGYGDENIEPESTDQFYE